LIYGINIVSPLWKRDRTVEQEEIVSTLWKRDRTVEPEEIVSTFWKRDRTVEQKEIGKPKIIKLRRNIVSHTQF
jgi:hypothetical protein